MHVYNLSYILLKIILEIKQQSMKEENVQQSFWRWAKWFYKENESKM